MKFGLTLVVLLLLFPLFSQTVQVQEFASGLTSPVEIANCGDDRLFVVQKNGQIKIIENDGTVLATPFLNISSLVSNSGEQGLLGMAFHPDFLSNGYFFVNYIRSSDESTVIARYQVSGTNDNIADPLGEEVLVIAQPYTNHNGGSIQFGPDGNLFIAMGDGGSGGDPDNYAQNKQSLLGKLLRINVDALPYTIPATNPYADGVNGKPEIYSIGLRNPWKFSFDNATEMIWIADVGQGDWEEVNRQPISDATLNYGWRCYEGNESYNMTGCDPNAAYVTPIHVYSLAGSVCAVTGGYVYRGSQNPGWHGNYFFSDYCTSQLFILDPITNEVSTHTGLLGNISTFGIDKDGEIYAAGLNNGIVYKLTAPNVGIEQIDLKEIVMLPNPTRGLLKIESEESEYNVTVFNLEGRKLATFENVSQIDLSEYEGDIFLVNYQSSQRQKTVKILVNQ